MRFNVTLVGLIAVAALLVGCGGGDSSSDDVASSSAQAGSGGAANAANPVKAGEDDESSKPLTKAEMIKEGDLLCKRSSLTIVSELSNNKKEYGPGFGNGSTQKQNEAGLLEIILPAIVRETQYISELTPPRGDEAEIGAIVSALRDGVKKTEADPSLAFAGPNPLVKAASLSKRYGFKICGN